VIHISGSIESKSVPKKFRKMVRQCEITDVLTTGESRLGTNVRKGNLTPSK
jgi:hypothetical protein